jgi:hypothetical protein
MEHREPPPNDAEGPRIRRAAPLESDRLALPAPDSPRSGRPAIDRARAAAAVIILSAVLLGSYLGILAIRAAIAWLGDQPAYQIPFREIQLDPPPPPWYRGGSEAFLEDVRHRARMPERFPLLGMKPDALQRVFQCSPWTVEVRVDYRPLGVIVGLTYRQPVALVEISPTEKYLIDESAVILPREDVDEDVERFAREHLMIKIKGAGLAPPQESEPGIEWKPRPGITDVAPGNGRIKSAAKLARFLAEKLRAIDLNTHPGLGFRSINPMDDAKDYRGLFLWNDDDQTYLLWGEAPGEEEKGKLSAEDKWARTCAWERSVSRRSLPEGHYWRIDESGLVSAGADRRPPASARSGRPPRDRQAILTKDSGQTP